MYHLNELVAFELLDNQIKELSLIRDYTMRDILNNNSGTIINQKLVHTKRQTAQQLLKPVALYTA